jgi:tetratricopeptide (TPR) repeat protein
MGGGMGGMGGGMGGMGGGMGGMGGGMGGMGGMGGGMGGAGMQAMVNWSMQQTRLVQSMMIENLIRIVITDADWDLTTANAAMQGMGGMGGMGGGMGGMGGGLGGGLGGGMGGGLGGGMGGGMGGAGAAPIKGDANKDQMFYYDPALAFVFRASSKRTTRLPSPYKRKDDAGGGGAAPAGAPGGGLGFNNNNNGNSNPPLNANNNNNSGNNAGTQLAANTPSPAATANFWAQAFGTGTADNALTIASVDLLIQSGKADQAVTMLKAALKHSPAPRPWMHEALALALEMSNGNPEEIEQALLSGADLKPGQADGYLVAAKAMAKHNKAQKAIEFCKKSAALNPQSPEAYLDALSYAQAAKDVAGMSWAAGHLLSHDWPITEVDLHGKARQAAEKLATTISQDGRGAEAAKLLQGFEVAARRDLVVKLTYQGEAELDLEATDPTGSTCTTLAKQSVGGGSLVTDGGRTKKYSVAEGFAGQYTFTVRRVWGRPVGGKATLEIIKNQGTAEERIERTTVNLEDEAVVTLELKDGRRQTPATVAAAGVFRQLVNERRLSQMGGNNLDTLAAPVVIGDEGKMKEVPGVKAVTAKAAEMEKLALLGQTSVDLPTQGGVGMTTSIRTSADGKSTTVKVEPIFVKQNVTTAKLPVIPGSGS